MRGGIDEKTSRQVGPGRPRVEGHDEKIIQATLRLIDHDKPITVNSVVEESGISRAALYRRWPSITRLIADALDHGRAAPEVDTSGDIKEALMGMLFERHTESRGVNYSDRRFRKRLELVMADRELQWAYWDSHVRRRRLSMSQVIQAGVGRGVLRSDLDVDAILDALLGVFYYQAVVRGTSIDDPDTLRRCRQAVEITWRGMQV